MKTMDMENLAHITSLTTLMPTPSLVRALLAALGSLQNFLRINCIPLTKESL
ncbi:hypothetical protein D9M68_01180 [compost metagenome]|uniref:Uncharacterized protein n=1 Tax=Pseudomonas fluorescens TaxID=294 RepID=A0A5E6PC08_PSEFL|nr:hypothetical protein PS647_00283 [Pseudomonas fluorescens]VVQ01969.1 hypothetical protein PS922_03728 [Pseudomonas fluorescens]